MSKILDIQQRNEESDTPERRFFRITKWAFLGLTFIMAISGIGAFLLSLRAPEQTVVPNMEHADVIDALVALQDRGLYARVELRNFADPKLKGKVISHNPRAGSSVRSGRAVTLLVSQGAVIEMVEDYRGHSFAEVQIRMQALGGESTLYIDDVIYVFDDAPVGTIIEQSPKPGTELRNTTGLDLVVSRGTSMQRLSVPGLIGLSWQDSMEILARDSIPFVFQTEIEPTTGTEGVIVLQEPLPGAAVDSLSPVILTIRKETNIPDGYVFGIFEHVLPEYPVSTELTAVLVSSNGVTDTLFTVRHDGGNIAFPYRAEEGSIMVLYRFDTEVARQFIMSEQHNVQEE